MRKLLILPALLLVALSTTALVGPDPAEAPEEFSIIFEEVTRPVTVYEEIMFSQLDGWDFGDREGYQCVLLEYFDPATGELEFLIEFEINNHYSESPSGNTARWEDQGGLENNDGQNPVPFPDPIPPEYGATFDPGKGTWDVCGSPSGQGSWEPSGEDHFPHYIESHQDHDPITFYTDDASGSFTMPGLINEDCDRAYWSPGDEPGEAVLWWDIDFPENAHDDGTAPLDCGGGGQEPFAVGRLFVKYIAPGNGVCIHDDGAPGLHTCSGVTEPPPPPPSPSPTCTPNPKTGLCPPPKD